MRFKDFAILSAAILQIVYTGCSKQHSQSENVPVRPRNVYLITATGLRADHLSSYFYQSIQTPGLDYLAYDGIRFTRAFSTSTDSLPAHLSIFSGLFPAHDSIFKTFQYFQTFTADSLPESGNTLPQTLRGKGYKTAAFAADPDLRSFVLRSGWFDTTYAGDSRLPLWQASSDNNHLCLMATEWALKMRSHPHFVFLNFFEPTLPYEPPVPFRYHYASHPYDGEVAAIDQCISHFIHALKQAGVFEESIIIFVSPFGENPEGFGRAGSLEEGYLKIPMMITASGMLPRQQMYETAVSLADVYPTVLSLLNLQGVSALDGSALFEKNSDRQIQHDFLLGGSFFPMQLGMNPEWFVWKDGWIWNSDAKVLKREEGYSARSTSEELLQRETQLRTKVKELTAGLPVSNTPEMEGSVLQLEEAYVLARSGNFQDALNRLSEPPLPETPLLFAFRSNLQSSLGKIDEARKNLQKAMKLPEQPELLLQLADLEIQAGKIEAAEDALKAYKGQMSYDIHSIIAVISRAHGRVEEAQTGIEKALQLNPKSAAAHRLQGQIFFDKAEYDRAEQWLKKALELQPDNKYTMIDLAATMTKLGKRDEVQRLCAKILIDSPSPELRERARVLLAE